MSLECSECERDLRGGHDEECSRWRPPQAWLCIEADEEGMRISNLPGGPKHCYFQGTDKHLPECGLYDLVAVSD